eukprot:gene631-226_t
MARSRSPRPRGRIPVRLKSRERTMSPYSKSQRKRGDPDVSRRSMIELPAGGRKSACTPIRPRPGACGIKVLVPNALDKSVVGNGFSFSGLKEFAQKYNVDVWYDKEKDYPKNSNFKQVLFIGEEIDVQKALERIVDIILEDDNIPFQHTVSLVCPVSICSDMIGPGGSIMKAMERRTGGALTSRRPLPQHREQAVVISGKSEDGIKRMCVEVCKRIAEKLNTGKLEFYLKPQFQLSDISSPFDIDISRFKRGCSVPLEVRGHHQEAKNFARDARKGKPPRQRSLSPKSGNPNNILIPNARSFRNRSRDRSASPVQQRQKRAKRDTSNQSRFSEERNLRAKAKEVARRITAQLPSRAPRASFKYDERSPSRRPSIKVSKNRLSDSTNNDEVDRWEPSRSPSRSPLAQNGRSRSRSLLTKKDSRMTEATRASSRLITAENSKRWGTESSEYATNSKRNNIRGYSPRQVYQQDVEDELPIGSFPEKKRNVEMRAKKKEEDIFDSRAFKIWKDVVGQTKEIMTKKASMEIFVPEVIYTKLTEDDNHSSKEITAITSAVFTWDGCRDGYWNLKLAGTCLEIHAAHMILVQMINSQIKQEQETKRRQQREAELRAAHAANAKVRGREVRQRGSR